MLHRSRAPIFCGEKHRFCAAVAHVSSETEALFNGLPTHNEVNTLNAKSLSLVVLLFAFTRTIAVSDENVVDAGCPDRAFLPDFDTPRENMVLDLASGEPLQRGKLTLVCSGEVSKTGETGELGTATPRGDGLVYRLPKDGTWAQFDMRTLKRIGGAQQWEDQGTLRLASVGQVTEGGQSCRWIEMQCDSDGRTLVAKALIPEKYLGRGQDPLEHVLRGWIRQGNAKPKELKSPRDPLQSMLPVVLAPPLQDQRRLEKKAVESKLGKLTCEGVTGYIRFEIASGPFRAGKMTMETRLHPKAPFGVVSSQWVFSLEQEGQAPREFTTSLTLKDFGSKAKSELADLW